MTRELMDALLRIRIAKLERELRKEELDNEKILNPGGGAGAAVD